MNEKLNLVEILKDCPEGTKLYSLVHGDVELEAVSQKEDAVYSIEIKLSDFSTEYYTKDGRVFADYLGECVLFPSKDQRDWSKFKHKKPKFDPKTLQPFDKVLARIDGGNAYCWFADFVLTPAVEKYDMVSCIMSNEDAKMIIPYNDDTKHLVGTTEEAPEFYRYWED